MMKLYNNEFETVPSLLVNNVVDLIYQAKDLGLTHVYIVDDDGNEFWEKISFSRGKIKLTLIKQKIKGGK